MEISTDYYSLKTASISDVEDLERIHAKAERYYLGEPERQIKLPVLCMKEGDAPSGMDIGHYRFLVLRYGHSAEGMVSLYEGYPDMETVYIKFMFLDDAVRHKGLGRRLIKNICDYYLKLGYNKIAAQVSLRDTLALRAFHAFGFDTLRQLMESDDGFNCLLLEKEL